jgi:hypothetical protein
VQVHQATQGRDDGGVGGVLLAPSNSVSICSAVCLLASPVLSLSTPCTHDSPCLSVSPCFSLSLFFLWKMSVVSARMSCRKDLTAKKEVIRQDEGKGSGAIAWLVAKLHLKKMREGNADKCRGKGGRGKQRKKNLISALQAINSHRLSFFATTFFCFCVLCLSTFR